MSSSAAAIGRIGPEWVRRSRRYLVVTVAGLVVAIGVGNLMILGLHVWASSGATSPAREVPGVHNFRVVDDKVWRGSRPTDEGYTALAKAGVTTIVDLRAESGIRIPEAMLASRGVDVIRIPMRDGQAPTESQVTAFLEAIRRSPGTVYVHCMAGVGRTGTMVAAYLVEMKKMAPAAAWRHNLSVGPPSLEQIAFVSDIEAPNVAVTALSRILDAPRRMLTYIK